MASKTGRLIMGGATALLLTACQTAPLSTAPSMGIERQGEGGGYGVLADNACPNLAYAVWANSRTEWLHFTGARNEIHGDVHTNDLFKMAGNNDKVFGASEATDGFSISGNKTNTAGTQKNVSSIPSGWKIRSARKESSGLPARRCTTRPSTSVDTE